MLAGQQNMFKYRFFRSNDNEAALDSLLHQYRLCRPANESRPPPRGPGPPLITGQISLGRLSPDEQRLVIDSLACRRGFYIMSLANYLNDASSFTLTTARKTPSNPLDSLKLLLPGLVPDKLAKAHIYMMDTLHYRVHLPGFDAAKHRLSLLSLLERINTCPPHSTNRTRGRHSSPLPPSPAFTSITIGDTTTSLLKHHSPPVLNPYTSTPPNRLAIGIEGFPTPLPWADVQVTLQLWGIQNPEQATSAISWWWAPDTDTYTMKFETPSQTHITTLSHLSTQQLTGEDGTPFRVLQWSPQLYSTLVFATTLSLSPRPPFPRNLPPPPSRK